VSYEVRAKPQKTLLNDPRIPAARGFATKSNTGDPSPAKSELTFLQDNTRTCQGHLLASRGHVGFLPESASSCSLRSPTLLPWCARLEHGCPRIRPAVKPEGGKRRTMRADLRAQGWIREIAPRRCGSRYGPSPSRGGHKNSAKQRRNWAPHKL